MKIKTAELIGDALDWAVAKCEGLESENGWHELDIFKAARAGGAHRYSTDPAQGHPIIERELLHAYPLRKSKTEFEWCCTTTPWKGQYQQFGPTSLIAAMRCHVASKLGDEVEIPEELL